MCVIHIVDQDMKSNVSSSNVKKLLKLAFRVGLQIDVMMCAFLFHALVILFFILLLILKINIQYLHHQ